MSVAAAMSSEPETASTETLRFHEETFVFDGLSIAYVLDEKYAERCLVGGVNGTNVTFGFNLPANRSEFVETSTDLQTWTLWDVPGNDGMSLMPGAASFTARSASAGWIGNSPP